MNRSPLGMLLLLSLIWGGSYYFIKVLLSEFGPWTIVFFRSALGLIVIAAIMLISRQSFEWRKMPWLSLAIVAAVNMAIPWAIIGFSETRITSSMASVLNAVTPLCSLLLGIVFFGAVSRGFQWLGMIAAVAGVVVLVGFPSEWGASAEWVGTAGMLIASAFYGLGSQLSKRRLHALSAYQSALGTLFFAMLGSGGAALATESIPISKLAVPEYAAVLAGLGVFGSGIAYILFYGIVKKGGPEYATMVTYLIPVSSLAWGSILLHETIHWNMAAGLVLILCGVYIAGRTDKSVVKMPEKISA